MADVSHERDLELRIAMFRELAAATGPDGLVGWREVRDPLPNDESGLRLMLQQQGIWKPRAMRYLLSLKSSHRPRTGNYDDFSEAITAIQDGSNSIRFDFVDSEAVDYQNQYIGEAAVAQAPIIFFLGIRQGVYFPIAPAYVYHFDNLKRECRLVFGPMDRGPTCSSCGLPTAKERSEAMTVVRERLNRVLS